ncbi:MULTISPECIES: sensor histidine kinase [Streptomyces]|uniref:histidine kinase n=1 Tax=Streptomyces tsukubensis (strain DSM 42081 / NBRC 108919 / NRRL 18488 / 9993) TaxID=1114943 RepID=I2MY79_STRT9|nr:MULTISPECIES: ATP-binding protein [Streptomyces]AZK94061.1 histidine kinase [Streptomyces tsukubensis]EIF89726.1 signal transduction histidine kinase, glucose-6-phosphate specific [Streptomyces tsukubensis NRRL18488]MYS62686.1 histidine kinase [Streptomyces sp. SID5473]QKM69825.1 histidine kinase [Streptomyces tsukubensis NRRL18488]TAI46201.1 histidine kinase [Streptomyces tsukubensis]
MSPARYAALRLVAAVRGRTRRWAASPPALDVIAAVSCFSLMVLDVPGLARADNSLTGFTATLVLGAGASTLVLRRRAPWVPYAVALGLLGWLHELTLVQFALYSLGRFRGRAAAVVATAGYVVVAYALFLLPGWPEYRADSLSSFLGLVLPIGVLAAGVGIAAYRQDLVLELQDQRARTAAVEAVQNERISVARDVHDLVGRELTVLAVRAEVLAARARGGAHQKDFEELADTARRAHLMLNDTLVHRADERTATPGLDGLAALAAESGAMGSPVALRIAEAAYALSPLRQAAVYRVVQECLTNAAKHAPGERVTVTIGLGGDRLRVVVRNPLPAAAPLTEPVSSGTGTCSMRERVASMGGELTAGPGAGVWEVVAVLPAGRLPAAP